MSPRNGTRWFILVDRKPVAVPNDREYGRRINNGAHGLATRVAYTNLNGASHWRDMDVSTVFLGLNHQFKEGREPLVFETLISGSTPLDGKFYRAHTWKDAKAFHRFAIEKALGRKLTIRERLMALLFDHI